MSALKEASITICLILIIGAIIYAFAPKGKLGGTVKNIVALILVVSVIAILFNVKKNISFKSIDVTRRTETTADDLKEQLNDSLKQRASDIIKGELTKIFKEYKITPKKVMVGIKENDNNELVVNNIGILVSREELAQSSNLRTAIEERIGKDIIINITSEVE